MVQEAGDFTIGLKNRFGTRATRGYVCYNAVGAF